MLLQISALRALIRGKMFPLTKRPSRRQHARSPATCFADANYVSNYGMPPREWYHHGIRLLGRTVVECTRDALGG